MHRIAGLLLAAALLVPAPASAARQLTVQSRDPQPGDVTDSEETVSLALAIQVMMDGTLVGTFDTEQNERIHKTETILDWGPQRRRIEVTFGEVATREVSKDVGGGRDSDVLSPLSGGTFVVDWTAAAGLSLQDASGAPVTHEQSVALQREYRGLGERSNRLAESLAGRKLTVGQTLDLPAEALAALVGGKDRFAIEEMRLTLRDKVRVDGKPCAAIDVEMVLTASDGGLEMVFRLTGDFVVRLKDGATVSFDFEGPLSATGVTQEPGGPPLQMNGGGTMKATGLYTRR